MEAWERGYSIDLARGISEVRNEHNTAQSIISIVSEVLHEVYRWVQGS